MFNDLPGHYKRAIIREANVIIEAKKLSKTYGKMFENEEFCKKEYNRLCESMSQNKETIEKLFRKDSEILYLYPLDKDRIKYFKEEVKDKARLYDYNFYRYNSNNR